MKLDGVFFFYAVKQAPRVFNRQFGDDVRRVVGLHLLDDFYKFGGRYGRDERFSQAFVNLKEHLRGKIRLKVFEQLDGLGGVKRGQNPANVSGVHIADDTPYAVRVFILKALAQFVNRVVFCFSNHLEILNLVLA